MFFSAPSPAAATAARRHPPSIQRLPAALAAATSSSAAVPSLEAALAAALSAATTATATTTTSNKITVSFFNENGSSATSSSSSSLSTSSYSGFEVEDAGNGYDEAFLRGIVALDEQQLQQPPTTKKLLLHPLASLASSASSSLPLSVSVTSRPRGGFETRVAEFSGGRLERIRLQPPPGRARPGATVRVSVLRPSPASDSRASASIPPSSSASSSLVDVMLAFALAREDLSFAALDAGTGRVLLESSSSEGGEGGNVNSLVLRALGSPASPPSFSSAVSSSITAKLWALVPPEGEVCPSSSSGNGPSCPRRSRRLCFVSVDGRPLEAPSLEAEVDSLFAEICASLLGERRREGGGGSSGGGGGGGFSFQKERGTAARTRRVPAFVLKLSTKGAAKASSGISGGGDDAARFCGRMGLPLLLSLGGGGGESPGSSFEPGGVEAEAAARACVREAALSCWRAVAPARLLPDPLSLLPGMPPPPPPQQQQQQQQQKRARFSSTAPPPFRRAPRSAPAVLVSSASSLSSSSSSNLLLSLHHRPPPRLLAAAAPSFSSQQQQQQRHPDSILTLDQLTAGASSLVKPRGGSFDDWGALSAGSGANKYSSSPSSAARPLAQLTAIDGRGSPTFLVAVVETTRSRKQRQHQQLLVAFDPHAAHERVRLEQLSEAYHSSAAGNDGGDGSGNGSDGGRSNISLPLPRPCELRLPRDGDAAEALRRHAAGLARWGWRWRSRLEDEEGKNAVVVVSLTHAAAVAGSRLSAADFLDHARALLLSSGSSSSSSSVASSLPPPAAPRALASRACRGAYMFSAGHRLSAAEASALLDSLSRTASPGICAHGRPTASALVDLGKLRALLVTRREARRGGGGGGEMKKMKVVGRPTTAATATSSSSSLSALIESLRLQVSRAEREEAIKND